MQALRLQTDSSVKHLERGAMIKLAIYMLAITISSQANAWHADVKIDEMTGKKEYTASVISENNVTLGFPYGKIGGRLTIRNHPRYGKDVIFSADKGQIPCRSYSPCRVLLRFDDQKPISLQGSNPSDGSTEVVFISGYDRITKELSKAKILKIQLEFYSNGNQIFNFDVSDFGIGMLSDPKTKPPPKR